jgi:hypothetical protein
MEKAAIVDLREALAATREAAGRIELHTCDRDDLEQVIAPAAAELAAAQPNLQTLSTYLNSLARSLRAEPAARTAVMQLDAAMRKAGVPTHWEH